MSVQIRSFLNARRNRAVGTIMGALEGKVRREDMDAVRRAVQEAINGYHDTALDLLRSEEDVIRNEEVLTLLADVRSELSRRGSNGRPTSVDERDVRGGAPCPG